jgi:hypothetical protein
MPVLAESHGSSPSPWQSQYEALPLLEQVEGGSTQPDWLLDNTPYRAGLYRTDAPGEIALSNGLTTRRFLLTPNAATVALDNHMTGATLLRGVKPEAQLILDGRPLDVGGLKGQPNYAYLLDEWKETLEADPNSFQLFGFTSGPTRERFAWKRSRYVAALPWPPPGVGLRMDYRLNRHASGRVGTLSDLRVSVHYELYDGIPLMSKWLTVHNRSPHPVRIDRFTNEILALVEYASSVESRRGWELPNVHVETDYAFHGMDSAGANKAVYWQPDPEYATQVNYLRKTPCLLVTEPPLGPGVTVQPGDTFETFRTYVLVHDSTERERKGLAVRRMMRTLAPWVTENPIMMHVRSARPEAVRLAIDQCADVGFEMVILTFGSGFNIESDTPEYVQQIGDLVAYAHRKGVELGGYSLLASRRISDEHDVVNPETGKPGGFAAFGNSPCLGSVWGQDYFRKLYTFFEATDFDLLEHDGSYPGDVCASTGHPGHRGLADSQWTQWRTITDYYKWCRARGVYLNVPDFYYLSGSNKSGMGYRETNWSLPRAQQIIHGRQNIYDGTWEKTPSMGWMFVPLTQYHGGGAAATIEPLSEHLDAYEAHLANNFGAGVQACYRGPRLYDTDETRAVVKTWVDFYKEHRAILDSDIIHLRRADGRDIDGIMHVNPQLPQRALAMFYNPLAEAVTRTLRLPLYYTGLTEAARIRQEDGPWRNLALDRAYNVTLPVTVPAQGCTWFVVEEVDGGR